MYIYHNTGIVGVLMVPIFSMADGGYFGVHQGGIFRYGGYRYAWMRLGVNIFAAAVIIAWSFLWSVIIFGTLNFFKLLRIDEETETLGCDPIKHGESAYPMDGWFLSKITVNVFKKRSTIKRRTWPSQRTTETAA